MLKLDDWSRRTFLRAGALAVAAQALPRAAGAANARSPLAPAEFKRRLRGPIVSLPTPFRADFQIDTKGLRTMLEADLHHGITLFDLTAGDSQYASLSYDEIKGLAQFVAQTVGDRGLVIVGTGAWWTERVVDFASHAEAVGAAALQVLKPGGAADDDLIAHYRRIAASTKLPLVLHGNFPLPLLARLAEIPSIVALKEDVSLSYYVDSILHVGQRINCFSGGGLDWFLVGQPYGATAYFDSYATFAPEIALRFWRAVERGDLAGEAQIVKQYDHPFIANFSAPFWHATLEYFGVAQRYLPPPQHSYSDAEMAGVKAFYDKLGVFPAQRSS